MLESRHVEYGAALFAIHPELLQFRNYLGSEAGDHFRDMSIELFPFELTHRPEADYAALIDRIQQIRVLFEDREVRRIEVGMRSFKQGSFMGELDAVLRRIYRARPELQSGVRLTWKRADILYPNTEAHNRLLAVAGLRDGALYAVAESHGAEPEVYVVRIPLDGSPWQRWGKSIRREAAWDGPYEASFGGSGGVLFWAGHSFVHFPTADAKPALWTPDSGYPGAGIMYVAELDHTFVMSLHGGYTLVRRPSDATWHLIVSTRRATPASPLDATQHSVPMIAQVDGVDRAFLVVQTDLHGADRRNGIDGIWSLNPDTLEIQQELSLTRQVYGWGQQDNGHIILHARRMYDRQRFSDSYAEYGIVRFDPFTSNAELTHQLGRGARGIGENLPRTEATHNFVFASSTNLALAQDYLWIGTMIITDQGEVLNVPAFEDVHSEMERGTISRFGASYYPVPGSRGVIAVGPNCSRIYHLAVKE